MAFLPVLWPKEDWLDPRTLSQQPFLHLRPQVTDRSFSDRFPSGTCALLAYIHHRHTAKSRRVGSSPWKIAPPASLCANLSSHTHIQPLFLNHLGVGFFAVEDYSSELVYLPKISQAHRDSGSRSQRCVHPSPLQCSLSRLAGASTRRSDLRAHQKRRVADHTLAAGYRLACVLRRRSPGGAGVA